MLEQITRYHFELNSKYSIRDLRIMLCIVSIFCKFPISGIPVSSYSSLKCLIFSCTEGWVSLQCPYKHDGFDRFNVKYC